MHVEPTHHAICRSDYDQSSTLTMQPHDATDAYDAYDATDAKGSPTNGETKSRSGRRRRTRVPTTTTSITAAASGKQEHSGRTNGDAERLAEQLAEARNEISTLREAVLGLKLAQAAPPSAVNIESRFAELEARLAMQVGRSRGRRRFRGQLRHLMPAWSAATETPRDDGEPTASHGAASESESATTQPPLAPGKPEHIVAVAIEEALQGAPTRPLSFLYNQLLAALCTFAQLMLTMGFQDAAWLDTIRSHFSMYADPVAPANFYRGKTIELCGGCEDEKCGGVQCRQKPAVMIFCSVVSLLLICLLVFQTEVDALNLPMPMSAYWNHLGGSRPSTQARKEQPLARLRLVLHLKRLVLAVWAQALWACSAFWMPIFAVLGTAFAMVEALDVQDARTRQSNPAFATEKADHARTERPRPCAA